MAYRCQGCGHFAGLDEPSLDVADEEYEEDEFGGVFRCTVSASYPSTCCGQEVGTATYSIENLADAAIVHADDCHEKDRSFSVTVEDPEATDRYQTHDRHGKPIKRSRYQRHYYGCTVEATIRCDACDATTSATGEAEDGPPEEV